MYINLVQNFFYIKCVTMSWCIQYELLYLQNRTTKNLQGKTAINI